MKKNVLFILLLGVFISCQDSSNEKEWFSDEGLHSYTDLHFSSDGKLVYFDDSSCLVVYDLKSNKKRKFDHVRNNRHKFKISDKTIQLVDRKLKNYEVYNYDGKLIDSHSLGADKGLRSYSFFLDSNLVVHVDSGSVVYSNHGRNKNFYRKEIQGFCSVNNHDIIVSGDSLYMFKKSDETGYHNSYFLHKGMYNKYWIRKIDNTLIITSEINSKSAEIVSFDLESKEPKVLATFDDLIYHPKRFVNNVRQNSLNVGLSQYLINVQDTVSILTQRKKPVENVFSFKEYLIVVFSNELIAIDRDRNEKSLIKSDQYDYSNAVMFKNSIYYANFGKLIELKIEDLL